MNCAWSDDVNKARQVVVRVRNLNIRVIRIGVSHGLSRDILATIQEKSSLSLTKIRFWASSRKLFLQKAVNKEIGLIANPHLTTRVSESEQKGGASCLGIVILVVVCLLR